MQGMDNIKIAGNLLDLPSTAVQIVPGLNVINCHNVLHS